MAISGGDGSIILSTKVDTSGMKQGTESLKSQAAKLAAEYRKAGMSQSEAFKKAWSEIERTNKSTQKATQSTKQWGIQTQKSGQQAKTAIGEVGNTLRAIAGYLSTFVGVYALINFGKEAVNLASDLQEVQNVVDVAFGDMAYKIESFSKTAIENFGISELTAKRTASTYMAMAKGMGIADDVASDMAITMTGLTADIASFYNMSQERADVILKSVYTGETETLKQLGIVMTEVNLENFAMSKGITKSLSAMTQQEKTMLRYQFVLEQTRLASGDFVRTQDSWANQTRILAERWKEMQTVFGKAFMTIGVLVLPVINNIIVGLTKVAQVAQVVAQWIYKAFTGKELKSSTKATQSQATALSGVGSSAEDAADGMADLGSSTKKANKEAKKSLAGFDDLEIITSNLADSADSAAGSMGEIGGGIGAMDTNVDFSTEGGAPDTTWLDTFSAKLEPARAALARLAEQLQPLKEFSSQALQDFYNLFLVPVGDWILGEGFPRFVDAISKQLAKVDWSKLNVALANLWKSVTPFAKNVGEGLLWFWENVITPLIGWALDNLIPAQIDLITAAIQFIDEIIQAAKPALLWFWDTFLVPIRDFIWQSIIDFINLMTDAFNALTDWAKKNQSTVENIATVVLGFLAGIWIYNSTKKLIEFCKNLGNAFVTLGNKMAEGGLKGAFFAASVGILAAGIITLAKQWDKMTPAERAITILGGLAAAATAAAIAIGIFHTAWSVGVAAAAIAGGLALLGLSFAFSDAGDTGDSAKQAADNFYSSYDWNKSFTLPALAKGAVLPPNKPFLALVGDQKHGTNIEAPADLIKQMVNEALLENGTNQQINIVAKGDVDSIISLFRFEIERQDRLAGATI